MKGAQNLFMEKLPLFGQGTKACSDQTGVMQVDHGAL